jgi:hypothetical protein
MECNEFRKKYNIKRECCGSCHDDDESGFGEDLWFEVEGRDWNICCYLRNAYDEQKKST